MGTVVIIGPSICSAFGMGALRPVSVSPNTTSFEPLNWAEIIAQAPRMAVAMVVVLKELLFKYVFR
jgi:hypothetical protein